VKAVRALIAEDEPLLAAGLAAELQRLWPGLEIVAQVGDGTSAVQQALALAPDLCFFDIRMPGQSGLDAAAALVEDWPADGARPFPLIVFVTAYEQHALQAFERHAVDYLVKPATPERLQACVARLQQLLAGRPAGAADDSAALLAMASRLRELLGTAAPAAAAAPRLEVIQAQVGSVVHLVPVDEVIYFEAADKYVRVVTAEREHLIRLSLRELLPQLDPQRFWQVHRGTVVQIRHVRQARREESGKVTLTLAGRPETLTASRLYAHLFKGL
jgi:DNA-binding LytR/AlgR family response regulator